MGLKLDKILFYEHRTLNHKQDLRWNIHFSPNNNIFSEKIVYILISVCCKQGRATANRSLFFINFKSIE